MEVLVVSKSFIVREALNGFFRSKFEDYKFKGLKELCEIKNMDLSNVKFMLIDIENDIIDKIASIKGLFENIKIVVFDKSNNNNMFLKSLKSNIDGYLVDIPEKEDLVYIIKKVLSGKKYYDIDSVELVIQNNTKDNYNDLQILTSREKEVLEKVGEGLTNKQIAMELYITEHTIKKHITSILYKLDMKSRKDLIVYTKQIDY